MAGAWRRKQHAVAFGSPLNRPMRNRRAFSVEPMATALKGAL